MTVGPAAGSWRAAASNGTFRRAWSTFILALALTDRTTRTLPAAASLTAGAGAGVASRGRRQRAAHS